MVNGVKMPVVSNIDTKLVQVFIWLVLYWPQNRDRFVTRLIVRYDEMMYGQPSVAAG